MAGGFAATVKAVTGGSALIALETEEAGYAAETLSKLGPGIAGVGLSVLIGRLET